jgi:hypothetical protein
MKPHEPTVSAVSGARNSVVREHAAPLCSIYVIIEYNV